MPSVEQVWDALEEMLDEIECRERSELEMANGLDPNSHGAGVSVGVLETVQRIREWMNDPETHSAWK